MSTYGAGTYGSGTYGDPGGVQPTPVIYQQIWIIDERKPKKKVKRAERRAKKAIQTIEQELAVAQEQAETGALQIADLENLHTRLTQHLDLVSLEYGKIEAEVRLNKAISEAKRQAEIAVQQRLEALAAYQRQYEEEFQRRKAIEEAERRRKEQEELEDLTMLLNYLMNEI